MNSPPPLPRTAFTGMRLLSAVCVVVSLAWVVALLVSDVWHGLHPYKAHQTIGAFALIFIGASYICLQLSLKREAMEMLQGLLLGMAFVLWGSEQLLPPRRLSTLMDAFVVSIFVVDLGVIIWGHLRRKDHGAP